MFQLLASKDAQEVFVILAAIALAAGSFGAIMLAIIAYMRNDSEVSFRSVSLLMSSLVFTVIDIVALSM